MSISKNEIIKQLTQQALEPINALKILNLRDRDSHFAAFDIISNAQDKNESDKMLHILSERYKTENWHNDIFIDLVASRLSAKQKSEMLKSFTIEDNKSKNKLTVANKNFFNSTNNVKDYIQCVLEVAQSLPEKEALALVYQIVACYTSDDPEIHDNSINFDNLYLHKLDEKSKKFFFNLFDIRYYNYYDHYFNATYQGISVVFPYKGAVFYYSFDSYVSYSLNVFKDDLKQFRNLPKVISHIIELQEFTKKENFPIYAEALLYFLDNYPKQREETITKILKTFKIDGPNSFIRFLKTDFGATCPSGLLSIILQAIKIDKFDIKFLEANNNDIAKLLNILPILGNGFETGVILNTTLKENFYNLIHKCRFAKTPLSEIAQLNLVTFAIQKNLEIVEPGETQATKPLHQKFKLEKDTPGENGKARAKLFISGDNSVLKILNDGNIASFMIGTNNEKLSNKQISEIYKTLQTIYPNTNDKRKAISHLIFLFPDNQNIKRMKDLYLENVIGKTEKEIKEALNDLTFAWENPDKTTTILGNITNGITKKITGKSNNMDRLKQKVALLDRAIELETQDQVRLAVLSRIRDEIIGNIKLLESNKAQVKETIPLPKLNQTCTNPVTTTPEAPQIVDYDKIYGPPPSYEQSTVKSDSLFPNLSALMTGKDIVSVTSAPTSDNLLPNLSALMTGKDIVSVTSAPKHQADLLSLATIFETMVQSPSLQEEFKQSETVSVQQGTDLLEFPEVPTHELVVPTNEPLVPTNELKVDKISTKESRVPQFA